MSRASLAELERRVATDTAALDALIRTAEDEQRSVGHRGTPPMMFDSEPFFGQDRLADLVWRMMQRGQTERSTRAASSANRVGNAMAAGTCNCGAVAFEIDADIRDVYVCHCSICRRSTGGNGIAVVVVGNDVFRWTRGADQIATWQKPGQDIDWQTWFCRICGSRVPGQNDPSRMFVPVGLIDTGGDALRVVHHIWVGSRACWDVIGDAGQQHPEAFGTGDD